MRRKAALLQLQDKHESLLEIENSKLLNVKKTKISNLLWDNTSERDENNNQSNIVGYAKEYVIEKGHM